MNRIESLVICCDTSSLSRVDLPFPRGQILCASDLSTGFDISRTLPLRDSHSLRDSAGEGKSLEITVEHKLTEDGGDMRATC
ncbi:hypothetical protein R1flu_016497 [Riccia fluitans]|uniref:Uncharacterized protein n=1 Tax=Riccia fluitans TaxID=41844 RepID=A0ABD1YM14_9MARC